MKPDKPKPAPDGQWEFPAIQIRAAFGHFIMGWSGLEGALEVCIAKQLGLKPLEGSIVTASIQFKSRCSILLALLQREPEKNAEAIKILNAIQNIGDRNDILHSIMGGSESIVWFNRRKITNKFVSKFEKYDALRLNNTAKKCTDLAADLMDALGVTKGDYVTFFQQSHNLTNNIE